MTNEQQPYRDPIYDEKPEKAWLVITNICDKGKFKVTLEVNGKEQILFHGYPDQDEGVISEHHNLTWLIKGNQTSTAAKENCDNERCQHPIGWHYKNAGSCLECSCLGPTPKSPPDDHL